MDIEEILLCPVPEDPRIPGTPVGRVGSVGLAKLTRRVPTMGAVLSYEGRQAYVDGRPVEHAVLAEALLRAVVAAANRLWGDLWVAPLVAVTRLGQRTAQRDRIIKFGLPTPVLKMLGSAAYVDHPRAVGYQLLAVATVWDEMGSDDEEHHRSGVLSHSDREDLDRRLHGVLRAAQGLVEEIREETDLARRIRLGLETKS